MPLGGRLRCPLPFIADGTFAVAVDTRWAITTRARDRPPLRGEARGARACRPCSLWHRARPRVPDAGRVFGDGAIARELPGAGHVQDGLASPRLASAPTDSPLLKALKSKSGGTSLVGAPHGSAREKMRRSGGENAAPSA